MKPLRFLVSAALLVVIDLSQIVPVYADSLTGAWSGTTLGIYENHFAFLQRSNNSVVGSGFSGNLPGVIEGSVSGNVFTFRSSYGRSNYGSNAQAVITGDTMTGTFTDSQGTSGGFTAQKDDTLLRSSTILYSPPIVEIKGHKVKVTVVKFTEVVETTGPQDGLKIRYDLRLTGEAPSSISSKSNKFTFANLPSGKYKVLYRVTATRNGKKLFTVNKSTAANFTIK